MQVLFIIYAIVAVIIQITFLVLKIGKMVLWSWWWIMSPVWITAILVAVLFYLMWLGIPEDDEAYEI